MWGTITWRQEYTVPIAEYLQRSGRIEARTGLRMMPTFLDPPYHSVRRVFPSTAGRLACQARPSQFVVQLKPAPGMRCLTTGLSSPFVHLVVTTMVRSESGLRTRSCTAWRVGIPPPQGPSLGSGL